MNKAVIIKNLKDELVSLQEADASYKLSLVSSSEDRADIIDQSVEQSAHNVIHLMSFKNHSRQKQIQLALVRLEKDPNYGLCEDCGDQIPEKRLLIMPTASCCVKCQEASEVFDFTYKKAI